MRELLAAAVLSLACVAAPAAAAPKVSAKEQERLQQALERGRLIYAYDRAAWQATDDLVGKMKDAAQRIGGWVVDGPPEAPELVFYDKNAAEPRAVYVAQFRDNKLVSSRVLGEGDDRSLSQERKRLITASRTAAKALIASKPQRCSEQPFNSVVLSPATAGGPVLVYFLAPQPTMDALHFGGHYLIEVAQDGTAAKPRSFTKSCFLMPLRQPGVEPPTMLGISHLLDRTPTEIHVFSSLASGLPVLVITGPNRVWEVTGQQIQPKNMKDLR